jgi:hypothetical protein
MTAVHGRAVSAARHPATSPAFAQSASEFNASSIVVALAELAFRQRSTAGSIKHRTLDGY